MKPSSTFKAMFAAVLAFVAVSIALPAVAAPVYSGAYYATPIKKSTYVANVSGLVPASAATDLVTISGSASKTIFVSRFSCTGTSTAASSNAVSLIKRSVADTAGTSTAPAAVPVDSVNAAATATLAAYTANPTVGAAVGTVGYGILGTNAPATAPATALTFTFGTTPVEGQYLTLRGTAQTLALSGLAGTFAAGTSLSCTVEWIEQ